MNKEAEDKVVYTVIGIAIGFVVGAFAFILTSPTPNAVCRGDCEVRGFEQGEFSTLDPKHCMCWNQERVFEKRGPADEEE